MKLPSARNKRFLSIFCCVGVVLVGQLRSAAPVFATADTIMFQGKITDSDGTNVSPGSPACVLAGADTCDFRFLIYSDSSATTLLWREDHLNVELGDNDGVFAFQLNSVCQGWTSTGSPNCAITNGGVTFKSNLYYVLQFDTTGSGTFAAPERFPQSGTTELNAVSQSKSVVGANAESISNQTDGTLQFSDSGGTNSLSMTLNGTSSVSKWLNFVDGTNTVSIVTGTQDPSSVATNADIGSLFLNSSTGVAYIKTDDGSSTNWTQIGGVATLDSVYTNDSDKVMNVDNAAGLRFTNSSSGNVDVNLTSTGDFTVSASGTPFATFDQAGDETHTGHMALWDGVVTSTSYLRIDNATRTQTSGNLFPISINAVNDSTGITYGIRSVVNTGAANNPNLLRSLRGELNFTTTGATSANASALSGLITSSASSASFAFLSGISTLTTNNSTSLSNGITYGGSFPIINNGYTSQMSAMAADSTNSATGTVSLFLNHLSRAINSGTADYIYAGSFVLNNLSTGVINNDYKQVYGEGTNDGLVTEHVVSLGGKITNSATGTVVLDMRGLDISITNEGTVPTIYGAAISLDGGVQATGDAYGISVGTISQGDVNNYGIYVAGASGGSNNNLGLFVDNSNSFFNGDIYSSGNMWMQTSGNYLDLASRTNGNTFDIRIPQKATTGTCSSGTDEGQVYTTTGGLQVGHLCIDGPSSGTPNALRFYAEQFNATSTDVAENYSDYFNELQPGDVVAVDSNHVKAIRRADATNGDVVVGIISSSPGIVLSGIDERGKTDLVHPKPVALVGRVPLKIGASSQPIQAGDKIALSRVEVGKGTKATEIGYTIATALESWEPGQGKDKIVVMVENGYYDPDLELAAQQGDPLAQFSLQIQNGSGPVQLVNMLTGGVVKRVLTASRIMTAELTADSIKTRRLQTDELKIGQVDLDEYIGQVFNSLQQASIGSGSAGVVAGASTSTPSATPLPNLTSSTPSTWSTATTPAQLKALIESLPLTDQDIKLDVSILSSSQAIQVSGGGYFAGPVGTDAQLLVGQSMMISDHGIEFADTVSDADKRLEFLSHGKGKVSFLAGILEITDGGQVNVRDLNVRGNAQVAGSMTVQGVLQLSQKNLGEFTIPAGTHELHFTFPSAFSQKVYLQLTPVDGEENIFKVKDVSPTGFTITLEKDYATDRVFSWLAIEQSPTPQ